MNMRIGDINGVPLYNSLYVNNDKLYKSIDRHNEEYIVVSIETGKKILKEMLLDERKRKLKRLF